MVKITNIYLVASLRSLQQQDAIQTSNISRNRILVEPATSTACIRMIV